MNAESDEFSLDLKANRDVLARARDSSRLYYMISPIYRKEILPQLGNLCTEFSLDQLQIHNIFVQYTLRYYKIDRLSIS